MSWDFGGEVMSWGFEAYFGEVFWSPSRCAVTIDKTRASLEFGEIEGLQSVTIRMHKEQNAEDLVLKHDPANTSRTIPSETETSIVLLYSYDGRKAIDVGRLQEDRGKQHLRIGP